MHNMFMCGCARRPFTFSWFDTDIQKWLAAGRPLCHNILSWIEQGTRRPLCGGSIGPQLGNRRGTEVLNNNRRFKIHSCTHVRRNKHTHTNNKYKCTHTTVLKHRHKRPSNSMHAHTIHTYTTLQITLYSFFEYYVERYTCIVNHEKQQH